MKDRKDTIRIIGYDGLMEEFLSTFFVTKNYTVIGIEESTIKRNVPIIFLFDRQSARFNETNNLEKVINEVAKSKTPPMPIFIITTTQHPKDNLPEINKLTELGGTIVEIQINAQGFAPRDKTMKQVYPEQFKHIKEIAESVGEIVERYVNDPPSEAYQLEKVVYAEKTNPTIGVVGLGYVGLPVAIGFAEKYNVIGLDTNKDKINALKNHTDPTREFPSSELEKSAIEFITEPHRLRDCTHIIVAVPTPITSTNEPDLTILEEASSMIGRNLAPNTTVVYESTVYPGTTEDICIPLLEESSGLTAGVDFHVGYSPERINPGDKAHTFKTSPKVIAGQTEYALEKVYEIYKNVLTAEIYKAPFINVAEAAKIIENTQRDINIAFMNELSVIFDKLNIDTYEVLEAAKTKWNFLPFSPGLVGGHCIGVDPYYLIHKSKMAGYNPKFLSAARELNDYMPEYIVQSLLELIISQKLNVQDVRITVLGITFKENISDIRNSKSMEIVHKLQQLGLSIQVYDPHVDHDEWKDEKITLKPYQQLQKADIVMLAVPHKEFTGQNMDYLNSLVKEEQGLIMDLKGVIPDNILRENINVWRL